MPNLKRSILSLATLGFLLAMPARAQQPTRYTILIMERPAGFQSTAVMVPRSVLATFAARHL